MYNYVHEADGFGLIQRIRADANYKDLPFIFLSAKTTEEDEKTGLQLGANAYLTKPFSTQELLKTIRNLLNQCLSY
jgi:DNA-binding response OmpR family regulator